MRVQASAASPSAIAGATAARRLADVARADDIFFAPGPSRTMDHGGPPGRRPENRPRGDLSRWRRVERGVCAPHAADVGSRGDGARDGVQAASSGPNTSGLKGPRRPRGLPDPVSLSAYVRGDRGRYAHVLRNDHAAVTNQMPRDDRPHASAAMRGIASASARDAEECRPCRQSIVPRRPAGRVRGAQLASANHHRRGHRRWPAATRLAPDQVIVFARRAPGGERRRRSDAEYSPAAVHRGLQKGERRPGPRRCSEEAPSAATLLGDPHGEELLLCWHPPRPKTQTREDVESRHRRCVPETTHVVIGLAASRRSLSRRRPSVACAYAYLRTLRCFLRVFSVDIALFLPRRFRASISDRTTPRSLGFFFGGAARAAARLDDPRHRRPNLRLQSSSSTPHADPRAFSAAAAISASRPSSPRSDGRSRPRPRRRARRAALTAARPTLAFAFDAVIAPSTFPALRATIACRKRTLRPRASRDARGGDASSCARGDPSSISLCVSLSTKRRAVLLHQRAFSSIGSLSPSSGSSRGSSPAARRASANASSAPRSAAPRSPRSSTHPPTDFSSVERGRRAHLRRRRLGVSRAWRERTPAHG